MGIQSMTGFGKAQFQNEDLCLLIEIKSVNNRFLETRFRLPGEFNQLEINLRKKIGIYFKRGSFDVFIQHKYLKAKNSDQLDKAKIKNLVSQFKEISLDFSFSAGDFLKPEFFQFCEVDPKERTKLFSLVEEVFDTGLKNLNESRLSEGLKLLQVINQHLKNFRELFNKIGPFEESYQEYVEAKLKTKFSNYKMELKLDENRFHQEVIFYMERLDIKEEINRISGHICEFERILDSSGEVGRKLDFLIQELSRETNTLGAKSGLKEISEIVLEMKLELEKMREQVANLE